MKKHARHIRVPEGNHRGQTSIHQDTKTMALVQYYQCEKHASPPGLEPGSLDYRCLFLEDGTVCRPVLKNNTATFSSFKDKSKNKAYRPNAQKLDIQMHPNYIILQYYNYNHYIYIKIICNFESVQKFNKI